MEDDTRIFTFIKIKIELEVKESPTPEKIDKSSSSSSISNKIASISGEQSPINNEEIIKRERQDSSSIFLKNKNNF